MGMKGNYTWEMAKENRKSKIKRAEDFVHGYPDTMSIAQYGYVLGAIKAAQKQAIEATLGFVGFDGVDDDLINSPELEVI